MDTPLTEQIRPGQPDAQEATEEDCLELMEMILGALGRDALGLGSSIAHPKESEEWKTMTVSIGLSIDRCRKVLSWYCFVEYCKWTQINCCFYLCRCIKNSNSLHQFGV